MKTQYNREVTLRDCSERGKSLVVAWANYPEEYHAALLTPAQMRRLARMLDRAADRIDAERPTKPLRKRAN